MGNPCHYCTERTARCHSECERYLAFRAEKDKEYEKRRISHILTEMSHDRVMNAKKKDNSMSRFVRKMYGKGNGNANNPRETGGKG